jgi:hypothetical protein
MSPQARNLGGGVDSGATDVGRSPGGSGYSAEPEPISVVSAVPVSIPNADILTALQDIRDDIDYACIAIMKLHEHRARGRLEARLLKIDKLIDSIVTAQ